MGIDTEGLPGLGIGLALLVGLSFGYAGFLNRLAAVRGAAFFAPGVITGTAGFLIFAVALQYSRAAYAGVSVGHGALPRVLAWTMAPGLAGSWLACRSVLRRLNRNGSPGILRPAAAFWGGLGLIALALLIMDALRLSRG
jgi:hypothetical protein